MSCEKSRTTLGGVEYNYTQLPASKSLRLKLRILSVFGEAIPKLISGLGKSDEEQIPIIVAAISSILKGDQTDRVADLVFDVIRTVQIDDTQIDIDKQFAGDLVGMYALVHWVLKKEFGAFLADVIGLSESKPVKPRNGLKNISQI